MVYAMFVSIKSGSHQDILRFINKVFVINFYSFQTKIWNNIFLLFRTSIPLPSGIKNQFYGKDLSDESNKTFYLKRPFFSRFYDGLQKLTWLCWSNLWYNSTKSVISNKIQRGNSIILSSQCFFLFRYSNKSRFCWLHC